MVSARARVAFGVAWLAACTDPQAAYLFSPLTPYLATPEGELDGAGDADAENTASGAALVAEPTRAQSSSALEVDPSDAGQRLASPPRTAVASRLSAQEASEAQDVQENLEASKDDVQADGGPPSAESTSEPATEEGESAVEAGSEATLSLTPFLESCPGTALLLVQEGRERLLCVAELEQAAARALCATAGLRLPVVRTGEENQVLTEALNETLGTMTGLTPVEQLSVWLDARDEVAEGQWHWGVLDSPFWQGAAEGSLMPGGYANWSPGRPNDVAGGEDCLALYVLAGQGGGQGEWNDVPCTYPRFTLCER